MSLNLLDEKVFTIKYFFLKTPNQTLSLPELCYALCQKDAFSLPKLQAHQKLGFITFLENLMALALLERNISVVDEVFLSSLSVSDWRDMLALVAGVNETAFDLFVNDRSKPAFFQPPTQAELKVNGPKGKIVKMPGVDILDPSVIAESTPDNLTFLQTSKDFDVKLSRIQNNSIEHWIYAIICIQTMSTYSGVSWYSTIKMASSQESRVGISYSTKPFFNHRVQQELPALLKHSFHVAKEKGLNMDANSFKLLWIINRHELSNSKDTTKNDKINDIHIKLTDCHPLFIDCARVYRLEMQSDGSILAAGIGTDMPLIDNAKDTGGDVGDFWLPIETKKNNTKALALSYRYKFTTDILFKLMQNQYIKTPAITFLQEKTEFQSGFFHFEGVVGGKCITLGYHSGYIPMTSGLLSLFSSDDEQVSQMIENKYNEFISEIDLVRKHLVIKPIEASGSQNIIAYLDSAKKIFLEKTERIIIPHLFSYLDANDPILKDNFKKGWISALDNIATDVRYKAVKYSIGNNPERFEVIAKMNIQTSIQKNILSNTKQNKPPKIPHLDTKDHMKNLQVDSRPRVYNQVQKTLEVIRTQNQNKAFLADLRRVDSDPSLSSSCQQMFYKVFDFTLQDLKRFNKLTDNEIKFWQRIFAWMSKVSTASSSVQPLGQTLQKNGLSEIRLRNLLHATGADLITATHSTIQILIAAGVNESQISWVDIALLLLTDTTSEAEKVRIAIADSYYKSLLTQNNKNTKN
jgi:hypothetical protein